MELEINGVFDLSESSLSSEDFQRKLLDFIESVDVSFGGAFYELDENGERNLCETTEKLMAKYAKEKENG